MEGIFHDVQNTGQNIELLLAKTELGLTTRVITKMIPHLLRRLEFGMNGQTFEVASP